MTYRDEPHFTNALPRDDYGRSPWQHSRLMTEVMRSSWPCFIRNVLQAVALAAAYECGSYDEQGHYRPDFAWEWFGSK